MDAKVRTRWRLIYVNCGLDRRSYSTANLIHHASRSHTCSVTDDTISITYLSPALINNQLSLFADYLGQMRMLTDGLQPQRPLKTSKVRDENMAVPTAMTNKTIHHRNKSSPALSTLVNPGAFKATAKRMAFADVSNTLRPPQPSKDDSTILSNGAKDAVKGLSMQIQDTQKPAAFLRPAHRPLSNMGLKSGADSIATIAEETKQTARRQTVSESNARPVPAVDNMPKGANKKNTMVFKDAHEISQVSVLNESAVNINGQAVPARHSLIARRQKSKTDVRPDPTNELLPSAEAATAVPSTAEARPQQQLAAYSAAAQPLYVDAVESQDQPDSYDAVTVEAQVQLEYLAGLELKGLALHPARQAEIVVDPQLPGVPDLEEWADEEGEPYYEDGYTTARSLKLRSDGNTTGGVTVVLNPKVTARTERELAAAKEMVESSRTEEDVEDETWDTSMVAEYGDEIFQYMRSLEVRDSNVMAIDFDQTTDNDAGENAAKSSLYGQSSRDSMVHAIGPYGLAGSGSPSLSTPAGDALPQRQLR